MTTPEPLQGRAHALLETGNVQLDHVAPEHMGTVRLCFEKYLAAQGERFLDWAESGVTMALVPPEEGPENGRGALRYVIEETRGNACARLNGVFLSPQGTWHVGPLPAWAITA
ncbi:hypothetical protein COU80_03120 [Candidatus Peregrinibacteria bacterium CG10_big_fil_rev_8_21_14_0_10_55_24]|nr:MAG: hypothetical protein COU80_03120 [Candidatus Peregrinibacteria bacterium CG10_big_fil_rev_8_21_14_0_10_55_24]